LTGSKDHLLESGYSKAASKNYRFRAATFLRRCPEVLEADESQGKRAGRGIHRRVAAQHGQDDTGGGCPQMVGVPVRQAL